MQHKNTQNNSLLAIENCVKKLPSDFTKKSNIELLNILNNQNSKSESAKTLIIYRYLPKVLKESKKIFKDQINNDWDYEEVIHTGIKAILYAIRDFNKQTTDKKSPAFLTHIIATHINTYLNKKKINYDPLIQFNKGPEFKKIFYHYFKALKLQVKKRNGEYSKVKDEDLLKALNTDIETLKEVQYAHKQLSVIKSQESQIPQIKNEGDQEFSNYIDYATVQDWVSPSGKTYFGFNNSKQSITLVKRINNYENDLEKKQNRNIENYKHLLTNVEYKVLYLLNLGNEKKQILNDLKISKQRFSLLTKNITKKIKKNNEHCLPV